MKSPKSHSTAESSGAVSGSNNASGPLETLSRISCECHQSAGRRRCSASPELEGQEGKENERRTGPGSDSCRVNGVQDKHESEDMDCDEVGKNIFPDDDSNQILPVEQFFGNLDAIQVRHSGFYLIGTKLRLRSDDVDWKGFSQRKPFPTDGFKDAAPASVSGERTVQF